MGIVDGKVTAKSLPPGRYRMGIDWRALGTLLGFGVVAAIGPMLILNNFYIEQWDPAWFQAVGSLLAVSVALALPFYQERKRKVFAEEDRYKKETAALISIFHDFHMLKSFLEMAGRAFENDDGVMLGALAYKNPGTYPGFLLNQNNDFLSLYNSFSSKLQYDLSMAVSPAREIALDVLKITEFLVVNGCKDPKDFERLLCDLSPKIKNKCLNNARIGFYHVNKIMEEGRSRFSNMSF